MVDTGPAMKRRTLLAVTLVMALTTAACGVKDAQTGHTGSTTPTRPAATTGAGSPSPTSVPATVVTPTTVAPTMLPGGQQGTAADVPWSLIGPGWILATVSAVAAQGTSSPPATIFLVDPQGGRYDLGPAPSDAQLTDLSGDGTRALFSTTSGTSETATVIGLQDGSVSSFSVPDGEYDRAFRFTRPDGLAVLLADVPIQSGVVPAQRVSLTGAVQETFPTSFADGSPETGSAIESPDGTELVFSTQSGIDLVSNNGQLIRSLDTSAGQPDCYPVRWWSASSILETCGENGLVVQPVDGSPATSLTSSANTESDLDAWQLPGVLLAQGAACGSTWISRVNAQGISARVNLPGEVAGASTVGLGVEGDQLAVVETGSCDVAPGSAPTPSSIDFFDPTSDSVVPVLGNGANGGWIDAAVMLTPTGSKSW